MTKKFDVVIGNPPYNADAIGDATHNMPIYHHFMDAAYEMGQKAILITPARFLFDAGYTPKAWNSKMLADEHLTVSHYAGNSDELFPGTDIKGGIVVTYRDVTKIVEPIGTFSKHPQLNDILHKVHRKSQESLTDLGITSARAYRYTDTMHGDLPHAEQILSAGHKYVIGTHAFQRLPELFYKEAPGDGRAYNRVLGSVSNGRGFRWILSDYISGPSALHRYKVALPAANGSGRLGETLASPLVLEPDVAVTQTFLTIGAFEARGDAENCLLYIKTRFARTMLGILKITQHNPARVWKYVPLQDFTENSDIDWSKSIPEIDQQLYAKYGLNDEEIEFIETHVKPMD